MQEILSKIRHHQEWIFKFILVALSIAAIVAILPNEVKFKYEFQKGKPWRHQDLFAPFDFAIKKTADQLKQEKDEVLSAKKYYYRQNEEIFFNIVVDYNDLFENSWNNSSIKNNTVNYVLSVDAQNKIYNPTKSDFLSYGEKILENIYAKGIIQIDENLEAKPKDFNISFIVKNTEEERSLSSFYTVSEAYQYSSKIIERNQNEVIVFYRTIIEELIRHNVFYDEEFTEKVLTQELKNISETYGAIQKDQKVIGQGDLINDENFEILNSLKEKYENQLGKNTNYAFVLIGQVVLVSLLISLIIMFLYLFRKDVLNETSKVAFLLLLVVGMVLLAEIFIKIPDVELYVLPFCLLPVLIRAFYDVRLAIYVNLMTSLLVGFIAPNSFEFTFIQIVAGITAIYSVINIQKRSQIFITSLVIFVAYCISYLGFSVIQEGNITNIQWSYIGWFAISSLLTILAYPLMFVFEKLFQFTSDVTLLELSDTNHPLLRQLSENAPGTFQHSLQVANLAEDAARNIGANSSLVRVGALYHDVGKMKNPAFFIENQSGINPHDEIDHQTSAKIIIQHVIDGIELAKKHQLPEEIIDFIRTHHGTTTTSYFFHSFKKENPHEEVNIDDFRYPGPLPFSKETAILMMADSCEAASRSLKKPDEQAIKNLVEQIIDSQSKENQYINADITFKDIELIKKLFIKKLQNIYHVRIEYPK
jgi:cyclic-di-AMP phosphodiesterase PgpH